MQQYFANLSPHQQLYLESQGNQTVITLITSTPQQQQSQATSWQTGAWLVPPILWQSAMGFIFRIEGQGGQFIGSIQGSAITNLQTMPAIADAQLIPLQPTTPHPNPASTFPSMPSMQPMPPMQPMQPMRMQLGNMQMQMGESINPLVTQPPNQPVSKLFCSQCGSQVKEDDRFCSHCGHGL